MVAAAYRKWSFTRGFKLKALFRENFGVLDRRLLMGGGHL